ncbi:MAG: radical SAM protein [Desulfobulbus sp.]|nr:MAG: radical SAM protein [Desulfobulbus sp.]
MATDHRAMSDPILQPRRTVSRPQSVDISLTGRCNLRCRYCYYNNEMVSLSDLPTDRWLIFFAELGELAVQRVTLSGGEVFTRPDLFELIDAIIENRMRYSLLTNGTLITEKTIVALSISKRRLRLDSIQVSIDGSNADVHNKSRPPNSFGRAMRGLLLLRDAGIPVTVRVTVNHHNVHDLENIAKLLLDDLGLPGFSTNEAEQMGTARCTGQDVLITEEERRLASSTLAKLNRRYDNRISATAGPLALANHFADLDDRLARGEIQMSGRGTLSSCGGVFSKMAVLHDGTMVPCNLLPSMIMGKIGIDPLQKAWLHHSAINSVRNLTGIPLSSLANCRECAYTGLCAGGCPAAVMAKFGKLDAADPDVCYRLYRQHREKYHDRL